MATEMITLKLEDTFLNNIDVLVKDEGYQSRTEFIRTALREKIEDVKLKKAMLELSEFKGKSSKKTSDQKREMIREVVFNELEKKTK